MFAPRRVPPCFTASVDASYSFMKEIGPDATPVRRAHDRPLRAQPREREAGAAARLMDERHRAQRVVDAVLAVGERIFHGQHEAG